MASKRKVAIPEGHTVVSVSQINTHNDCPRKRAFEKDWKVPTPKKDYFAIGTALHTLCEDYLAGVDEPWKTDKEWWKNENGIVTPANQAMIRDLVKQGIKSGMLMRSPTLEIERYFLVHLAPKLRMQGFIDVLDTRTVGDHKSPSDERFVYDEKTLATDNQLLSYARIAQILQKTGPKLPIAIWHNYFFKSDGLDPRRVEAIAEPEQIEENWQKVIQSAIEIQKIKDLKLPIEAWKDIPGPDEPRICRKYGGCPFAEICSGIRTVGNQQTPVAFGGGLATKGTSMFHHLANRTRERHGTAKQAEDMTKNSIIAPDPAPWYVEGCPMCSKTEHKGFKKNGDPCAMCKVNAKKQGLPSPDDFTLHIVDGHVFAEEKVEAEKGQEEEKPEPKASTKKSTSKKAAAKKPEPEPDPEPPADEDDAADETEEADDGPSEEEGDRAADEQGEEIPEATPPKRTGRPKKSFILVIGGVISPMQNGTLDLSVFLKEFDEWLESQDINPHTCDQFEKAKKLRHWLSEICKSGEKLPPIITASQRTHLEREAVSLLETFAQTVFRANLV